MTLSQILDKFLPLPEIADAIPFAKEYAPEIGDTVICVLRDCVGVVDAVGYPYNDNVERWYVVGDGWADWLELNEIF